MNMNKEAIIDNIEKSFLEKKNSHAFLFETNNISKCYDDVLNIIKVTRLSYGIPMGVEIDYLDSLTLDQALLDRKEIS